MKTKLLGLGLTSLMLLCSLAGCVFEDDGSSGAVMEAVFSFSPSTNIQEGTSVNFDASSSLPNDGTLSYRWDFDADGSTDETGQRVDWRFDIAGEYVVTLTISDGVQTSSQDRTITIVGAEVRPPTAEITSFSSDEDCEGDDVDTGNYILVWLCPDEKTQNDRNIDETVTISLDASESEAGSNDDYIAEWRWDLDLNEDADNDGDSENDADLSGEEVDWADVAPGEYEIALTIVNGGGMTDTDTMKLYVNYAAFWLDFEIGGNTSNNPVDIDFGMPVVYDKDSGNTIRKAIGKLIYPQQDDDWVVGGGNNNNNRLDLYAFNEEDDEVHNTTSTPDDQRDEDDCDSDSYCVNILLSSYMMTDTTNGDGDWTMTLRNERFNDIQVTSLGIFLEYK